MALFFMFLLQVEEGGGGVPDIGVRVSVWFIGMFLLALGAALFYLRIRELDTVEEDEVPGGKPRVKA